MPSDEYSNSQPHRMTRGGSGMDGTFTEFSFYLNILKTMTLNGALQVYLYCYGSWRCLGVIEAETDTT